MYFIILLYFIYNKNNRIMYYVRIMYTFKINCLLLCKYKTKTKTNN